MSDDPYQLLGPDDFVRLDGACAELLQGFVLWLRSPAGDALPPDRAGATAHDADRYLRDFVVDCMETGPSDEDPTLVARYLSNWYVVKTLEPGHEEIDRIALSLSALYRYLGQRQIVSPHAEAQARCRLENTGYFHDRLETFWGLTSETIPAWLATDDYRRHEADG